MCSRVTVFPEGSSKYNSGTNCLEAPSLDPESAAPPGLLPVRVPASSAWASPSAARPKGVREAVHNRRGRTNSWPTAHKGSGLLFVMLIMTSCFTACPSAASPTQFRLSDGLGCGSNAYGRKQCLRAQAMARRKGRNSSLGETRSPGPRKGAVNGEGRRAEWLRRGVTVFVSPLVGRRGQGASRVNWLSVLSVRL